jgi:hypothetical protein
MVTKKTNKISQKDINLLLKKFIIIIRKISNSCGNKNKKIAKGGGFFDSIRGKEDKNLLKELNSFIDVELKKSVQNFYAIATDPFKNLSALTFFSHENINPDNKDSLHNTENVQYNKSRDNNIEVYIERNKGKILSNINNDKIDIVPAIDNSKNHNGFYILYLYNNDIKYITTKFKDINSVQRIYKYYILNENIYKEIKESNEYNLQKQDLQIIKDYAILNSINLEETKVADKEDPIISYYKYFKYIRYILNKYEKKPEQFDIEYLKNLQENGGKINYNILKHATILNIGIVLKTLKNILINYE